MRRHAQQPDGEEKTRVPSTASDQSNVTGRAPGRRSFGPTPSGSKYALEILDKALLWHGTMNAISGDMSILSPLGRISTPRVNRVPSPTGSTV